MARDVEFDIIGSYGVIVFGWRRGNMVCGGNSSRLWCYDSSTPFAFYSMDSIPTTSQNEHKQFIPALKIYVVHAQRQACDDSCALLAGKQFPKENIPTDRFSSEPKMVFTKSKTKQKVTRQTFEVFDERERERRWAMALRKRGIKRGNKILYGGNPPQ